VEFLLVPEESRLTLFQFRNVAAGGLKLDDPALIVKERRA
jgi:hypothetical protein